MKKVSVNKALCIKCGACVSIDSDHFDFDDEGFSKVINSTPNEMTFEAVSNCPTNAIMVEDCESCDCDCGCDVECDDECECGCENCHCHEE